MRRGSSKLACMHGWQGQQHCSGREALGVAWEEGGLADVVQAAEQHDDALQAHAKAAVRRRTKLESVYVRLDGVQRDLMQLRPLWCRSHPHASGTLHNKT